MFAGVALGTPVFMGHIEFHESYGSIGGGEFRALPEPDFTSFVPASTGTPFQFGVPAGAPQFETFCVEKFEDMDTSPGVIYDADLNTETTSQDAHYAGGALGGFNDPLDARTAYLYDHFIRHTLLTPYDYINEGPRINDANALQAAIWFIEADDVTPLTGKALALLTEANAAVASGGWSGIGDVRILNIYTNSSRVDYQDELVLIPSPAGVACLGLAGLVGLRRRR
jgi:hypothetical protein